MNKRVEHQPRRRSFTIMVYSLQTGEQKCYRAMSIRQAMRFLDVGQSIVYDLLSTDKAKVIGFYIVTMSDCVTGLERAIPDKALGEGGFEC